MDLRLILTLVLIGLVGFVAVQHGQMMMNRMGTMDSAPRQEMNADEEDHHADADSSNPDVQTVRMVSENGSYHFEPHVVRIEPGATVRWVLQSGRHTTTSYDPSNGTPLRIPEGANGWDSGTLSESGATFDRTFRLEGVYDYFCVPHEGAGMVGTVVVGSAREGPGLVESQSELPDAAQAKIRELNAAAQNPQAEGEADHHE